MARILKISNNRYLRTRHLILLICITIFFSVLINFQNPTILPETLRFTPTCYKISPENEYEPVQTYDVNPIGRPLRYKYPEHIKMDYSNFNHHSWLPRWLDSKMHAQSIDLLRNVSELFRRNNITFAMFHGTLLGSYMFHDIIPWDDDLDIIVAFKDVNRVRAIIRDPKIQAEFQAVTFHDEHDIYSEPYIQDDVDVHNSSNCGPHPDLMKATCMHKFHFFRHDSIKTMRRNLGFPFIDIKFFAENETRVWTLDEARDPAIYLKEAFLPTYNRPYFDLWLPAPRKTRTILRRKYKSFQCASKWYSHQTQTFAMGYQARCAQITNCYPYVRRLPYKTTNENEQKYKSVEQLMLGDIVLHEVLTEERHISFQEPLKF